MRKHKRFPLFLLLCFYTCLIVITSCLSGCADSLSSITKSVSGPASSAVMSAALSDNDPDLRICVLNVGQADATLIQYKGKNMLIDTGEVDSRDALVKQLKERGVREIDAIILTHPHADHIGGMTALFRNFTIRRIYDNGVSANNALYRNYIKNIKEKKIAYKTLRKGDTILLGDDVRFNILSPSESLFSADNISHATHNDITNNNSIVCRMTYKKFSMLFTGDAQHDAEKRMLKEYGSQLQSNVLKVGHHGSKTSSSLDFIRAVHPAAAAISCGSGNRYQFPHSVTLDRLQSESVNVFRVDHDGIITIISDGDRFTITKEH